MKTKRCLIVDDEPLALSALRRLLAGRHGIEVVGEAHSVATARAACLALNPDLILLDVNLGDGSGFDLLAELENPPAVIFTTAYTQHAAQAFHINALDYLLKPVDEARLVDALERADQRFMVQPVSGVKPVDAELIEIGSTGRFIRPAGISFIQAEDKYTRVYLEDGSEILTQTSLSDWQRRLECAGFVRLDRQWLVRPAAVHSGEFVGREAKVKIRHPDVVITVGRTGAMRLRQMLRDRVSQP